MLIYMIRVFLYKCSDNFFQIEEKDKQVLSKFFIFFREFINNKEIMSKKKKSVIINFLNFINLIIY